MKSEFDEAIKLLNYAINFYFVNLRENNTDYNKSTIKIYEKTNTISGMRSYNRVTYFLRNKTGKNGKEDGNLHNQL
jgi:hypothetical protein